MDPTTSSLQKGKVTNTGLKNVIMRCKSSKDSQWTVKEAKQATPIEKMSSTISKSLTVTFTWEDVEIEILDYQDPAKTIEKEGTQVKCTRSIQEGVHSLASGRSSQGRHSNRWKKRTKSSDVKEISFLLSLARVSPLKIIKLISSLIILLFLIFMTSLIFNPLFLNFAKQKLTIIHQLKL